MCLLYDNSGCDGHNRSLCRWIVIVKVDFLSIGLPEGIKHLANVQPSQPSRRSSHSHSQFCSFTFTSMSLSVHYLMWRHILTVSHRWPNESIEFPLTFHFNEIPLPSARVRCACFECALPSNDEPANVGVPRERMWSWMWVWVCCDWTVLLWIWVQQQRKPCNCVTMHRWWSITLVCVGCDYRCECECGVRCDFRCDFGCIFIGFSNVSNINFSVQVTVEWIN